MYQKLDTDAHAKWTLLFPPFSVVYCLTSPTKGVISYLSIIYYLSIINLSLPISCKSFQFFKHSTLKQSFS